MDAQFLCFYYNVAKFVENHKINIASPQYDILGLYTFVPYSDLTQIKSYFYDSHVYTRITSSNISYVILDYENIGTVTTLNDLVNKNSVLTDGKLIITNNYIYDTHTVDVPIVTSIKFKKEIINFLIMKSREDSANLRLLYDSNNYEYIIVSCTKGELNMLSSNIETKHRHAGADIDIMDYKNKTHKIKYYDFINFLKKEYMIPDFTLTYKQCHNLYLKLLLVETMNEFKDFYFNLFEKREYSFRYSK